MLLLQNTVFFQTRFFSKQEKAFLKNLDRRAVFSRGGGLAGCSRRCSVRLFHTDGNGLYWDKENPSLVFSGDREIPTRGSTVPVGNEASPSFPLER